MRCLLWCLVFEPCPFPFSRLWWGDVRYREIGLAIAKPDSRPDAQPVGQRNADQDLVGRQRRAIAAVAQRERAIQRIGGVDPFQLGEHGERFVTPRRAGALRHRTHPDRLAQRATAAEGGFLRSAPLTLAHCASDFTPNPRPPPP